MELLEEIYKTASMGADSTKYLITDLKNKDNKIKSLLEDILKGYEEFMKKSCKLLKKHNEKPISESMMAQKMAKLNIKKEVKSDNSDSAIADMLIQGITLGNLELEKGIKNTEDKAAIKLAKEFINFSKDKINQLKGYL